MKTKTKIQKISSKGQVTLPVAWRKFVNTDMITVEAKGEVLEIRPARLQDPHEFTVFDAVRDNNVKGLYPEEIKKILERIQKENG